MEKATTRRDWLWVGAFLLVPHVLGVGFALWVGGSKVDDDFSCGPAECTSVDTPAPLP